MMTFHSFLSDLTFGNVRVPSYSSTAQSVLSIECILKTYFKYLKPQCLLWQTINSRVFLMWYFFFC